MAVKTKLATNLEQCAQVAVEFSNYADIARHLIKCYNEDSLNTIRFYNSANYMDTYIALGDLSIHIETVPRPRRVGDKVVSNDVVVTHVKSATNETILEGRLSDIEKMFRHEKYEGTNIEPVIQFLTFANYVHKARNIENEAVRRFFLEENKVG